MEKTVAIIRRSIFTFLKNYEYFTSTPSLLALPFAVSCLVSQLIVPTSPLFAIIHLRLRSLFLAAGLPPSAELFAILNLKLSQTIVNFLFSLPFTISLLLLAKASVIQAVEHKKPDPNHVFSSWIQLLSPLLITQFCNSLLILSANATCFCLIVISFNFFDILGALSAPGSSLLLSAIGAIICSIILANAYVICNLALVLSGYEKAGGFISILKTYVLIQDRTTTALSLALPFNMALAGIEALFQYRFARAYNRALPVNSTMVLEGLLIAYLYAMVLVLDTIAGCIFFTSCRTTEPQIHQVDKYFHGIEIQDKDCKFLAKGI
ncbi:hypothetical protein F511_02197 [Dorcoceras hygrometricum]|uniref:Uncharacterized protein n=1 Tax=Dorcoceras hygrometricum TaxID=472368 RepID=A0A2Z7APE3_9LAMI|nr:hypothetical protein F511_02197 [Dorcoceras hygrometricum]